VRVLWFTNCLLPAVVRRQGLPVKGSGFWMSALLRALESDSEVNIAVVTAAPDVSDFAFQNKSIQYFVIGQKNRRISLKDCDRRDIEKCKDVVHRFKPDLIHVHGTERFYGLLSADNHIGVPTLVTLQGHLKSVVRSYWNDLAARDIITMHGLLQLLLLRGSIRVFLMLKKRAGTEDHILRKNRFFSGRTQWDRSQLYLMNPKAKYFHIGEILRSDFYNRHWDYDSCDRHTIIFTNANSPIRGVKTLLVAVSDLKKDFKNIRLRLVGTGGSDGYRKFLTQQVHKLKLSGHVDFVDYLGAGDVASLLEKSHVFVIASTNENSPNSLCEAQLVGLPCIASNAGGITSLVEDEKTGLLFPPGNAGRLAAQIQKVFNNKALASNLGKEARKAASLRHAPRAVVKQLKEAYTDVLESA